MAFKVLSDSLHKASDKTEDFVLNTAEYYKLRLFKSTAKGAISLINILVAGIVLLLILLFISIGAALWIGDALDSRYWGYFIVAAFYILVLLLLRTVFSKKIQTFILLKFSDIFFDNDDEKPELEVRGRATIIDPGNPKTEDI